MSSAGHYRLDDGNILPNAMAVNRGSDQRPMEVSSYKNYLMIPHVFFEDYNAEKIRQQVHSNLS